MFDITIFWAHLAEDPFSERVEFTSEESMMQWVRERGAENCEYGKQVYTYFPDCVNYEELPDDYLVY